MRIDEILKIAASSVGKAHLDSSGLRYYAIVPWDDNQPRGATTRVTAANRRDMRLKLDSTRVAIAIALYCDDRGIDNPDIEYLDYRDADGSVSDWRGVARMGMRHAMSEHNNRYVMIAGREYSIDAARAVMDDDICDAIHGTTDTNQEFVDRYAAEHRAKFGEEFVIN